MSEATMRRLLLPRKPTRAAERPFLPEGNVLPSWFNMSLIQKLPMFPYPAGALELFQTKLGRTAFRNMSRYDFFLDDPHNYLVDSEYNPLTDPHLLHLWKTPKMQALLKNLGEITSDQKVRCSLKDFNRYRTFLKRLALNEFRKQQAEQRKNLPKIFPEDKVEVSYIETRVHEREVRTRQQKMEEERQEKFRSQLCQTERRLEIRRRRKQWDFDEGNLARKRHQHQQHRDDVYRTHMIILRTRARKKFRAWKRKMRRHLEHMKQLEEQRIDDADRKLREGWEKKRMSDAWQLAEMEKNRELEQERAHRYQRMFEAEMLRRWHQQAGEIQARKELSRLRHMQMVRETTRNLAHAFARSRLINPEGYRSRRQKSIGAGSKEDVLEVEGTAIPPQPEESAAEAEESGAADAEDATVSPAEPKIPTLLSMHTQDTKEVRWSFEDTLQEMDVNVRLHKPGDKKSAQELQTMQKAMQDNLRNVSGEALDNLPPFKHRHPIIKKEYKGKYPARVQVLKADARGTKPEDEIRLFMSHEEMIARGLLDRGSQEIIDITGEESEAGVQPAQTESTMSEAVDTTHYSPFSSAEDLLQRKNENLPTPLDNLPAEDKNLMETLLMKLLSDTRHGTVTRADMMRLTSICSSLWGSVNVGEEHGTSTTSLAAREIVNFSLERVANDIRSGAISDANLILATAALARSASSESLPSEQLEDFLNDTLERAQATTEEADDIFNAWLVEEAIKTTVDQLTADLDAGNLSRDEVREIGSAVASVVLGEVRSDDSMLADEVIVPTLQQVLVETDSIDDTLLDHTLATLLSSYTHVTRRMDKPVWDIIRDFIIECLVSSKVNLREMVFDPDEFVEALKKEQEAAECYDMDIPQQDELIEVLSAAVGKFVSCVKPTPVLCDLMKAILGPAQDELANRRSAENLTLPRINPSMIDQAGESACCLEVALEVTASVCEGLLREMAADRGFKDCILRRLGPTLLFIILSNWEELSAGVAKDNMGVQTKDFKKEPVIRPSQAESLVLLCWYHLWQDAKADNLPISILYQMGMQVAEFPALRPVRLHACIEETRTVPNHVLKKIGKLCQMLESNSLGYEEAKKLLTILLHIYIREVLCSDRAFHSLPERDKATQADVDSAEEEMKEDMLSLIVDVSRKVLEFVQSKVSQKLSDAQPSLREVGFPALSEVLQRIAEEAYADMQAMDLDIEIAEDDLSQLEFIIRATHREGPDPATQMDSMIIRAFFSKILSACQSMQGHFPDSSDFCVCKTGDAKVVYDLILRELWKVSNEISSLFSALSGQQESADSSPVAGRLVTFLISLLLELRRVLEEKVLPIETGYAFLLEIAPEILPKAAREDEDKMYSVIVQVIQDIEDRRTASRHYVRLTNLLSELSLEQDHQDELPQGMAATANLLASMDQNILNQFIQTTLLALLRGIQVPQTVSPTMQDSKATQMDGIRDSSTVTPVERSSEATVTDICVCGRPLSTPPDETFNRRPTPASALSFRTHSKTSDIDSLLRSGSDAPADKEIAQESRVIAHVALQKTLERLGATATPEFCLDDDVVHTVVSRIRQSVLLDSAGDSRRSSAENYSPRDSVSGAVENYAEHLAQLAEESLGKDYEDLQGMTKSILTTALETVEECIANGKLKVLPPEEVVEEVTDPDEIPEPWRRLSSTICGTLRAVKSELCLVKTEGEDKEEAVQEKEAKRPTSRSEQIGKAMQRTKDLVDFLVKRVELDVEANGVSFQLTQDKRISVFTPVSPSLSRNRSKGMSFAWSTSNPNLSDTILVTFRDVLKEMHEQNRFFRPDSKLQEEVRRRSSVTVPGLPYLVDEFILTNLQDISAHLVKVAANPEAKLTTHAKNTLLVARSFHSVISHMLVDVEGELCRLSRAKELCDSPRMSEEGAEEGDDQYDQYKEELVLETLVQNRRMMVLHVLDVAFHRCYCGASVDSDERLLATPSDVNVGTSSEDERQAKADMTSVIHFMQNVVPKVNYERLDEEDRSTMSDDQRFVRDVVMQATLRTIDHVQDGNLSDADLDKLCRAFGMPVTEDMTREQKQVALAGLLNRLLDDVCEGRIQRERLQRATKELGMRTFDKTTRPVLCKTRSRDQQFLRRALSGIVDGLTAQEKDLEDLEEEEEEEETDTINDKWMSSQVSRPRSLSQPVSSVTTRPDAITRPRSRSVSYDRHVTAEEAPRSKDDIDVVKRRISTIEERTVSKTNVTDGTINRKPSLGIYATTVPLEPLDDVSFNDLYSIQSSEPETPDDSGSAAEEDAESGDSSGKADGGGVAALPVAKSSSYQMDESDRGLGRRDDEETEKEKAEQDQTGTASHLKVISDIDLPKVHSVRSQIGKSVLQYFQKMEEQQKTTEKCADSNRGDGEGAAGIAQAEDGEGSEDKRQGDIQEQRSIKAGEENDGSVKGRNEEKCVKDAEKDEEEQKQAEEDEQSEQEEEEEEAVEQSATEQNANAEEQSTTETEQETEKEESGKDTEQTTEESEQFAEDAEENVGGNAAVDRGQTPLSSGEEQGVSRAASLTSGSKGSLAANQDWNRSAVRSTRKSWVTYADEVPDVDSFSLLRKRSRPPFRTSASAVSSNLALRRSTTCTGTDRSRVLSANMQSECGTNLFKYSRSQLPFTGSRDPLFSDWKKILGRMSKSSFSHIKPDTRPYDGDASQNKKKRHKRLKRKKKKKSSGEKTRDDGKSEVTLPCASGKRAEPPSYPSPLDMAEFWVGEMGVLRHEKVAMMSSSTMVNRAYDSFSCNPSSVDVDLSRTPTPSGAEPRRGKRSSSAFYKRETSAMTLCTLSSTDDASMEARTTPILSSNGHVTDQDSRPCSVAKRKKSPDPAPQEQETPGVSPEDHGQSKALDTPLSKRSEHVESNKKTPAAARSSWHGFKRKSSFAAIQRASEALSASATSFTDAMELNRYQQKMLSLGKSIFDRKQKGKIIEEQKQQNIIPLTRVALSALLTDGCSVTNKDKAKSASFPRPPQNVSSKAKERSADRHVEWDTRNTKLENPDTAVPHPPSEPPPPHAVNTAYLPLTVTIKQDSEALDLSNATNPKLPCPPTEAPVPLSLEGPVQGGLDKPDTKIIVSRKPLKQRLIKATLPVVHSRPKHQMPMEQRTQPTQKGPKTQIATEEVGMMDAQAEKASSPDNRTPCSFVTDDPALKSGPLDETVPKAVSTRARQKTKEGLVSSTKRKSVPSEAAGETAASRKVKVAEKALKKVTHYEASTQATGSEAETLDLTNSAVSKVVSKGTAESNERAEVVSKVAPDGIMESNEPGSFRPSAPSSHLSGRRNRAKQAKIGLRGKEMAKASTSRKRTPSVPSEIATSHENAERELGAQQRRSLKIAASAPEVAVPEFDSSRREPVMARSAPVVRPKTAVRRPCTELGATSSVPEAGAFKPTPPSSDRIHGVSGGAANAARRIRRLILSRCQKDAQKEEPIGLSPALSKKLRTAHVEGH